MVLNNIKQDELVKLGFCGFKSGQHGNGYVSGHRQSFECYLLQIIVIEKLGKGEGMLVLHLRGFIFACRKGNRFSNTLFISNIA